MSAKLTLRVLPFLILVLGSFSVPTVPALRAQLPEKDMRASMLADADHFNAASRIPPLGSREQWEARKRELKKKVQISLGLWPLPEKNDLNARIFDWKEGDGFKVAKVHFESRPGYLATGNLWMPTRGDRPFPAVLCPHGHWTYGRLTNSEDGSLPGRYIDFARMGFVVLSIDMVGYNDCIQLPHDNNKSRAQLNADQPVPYEGRQWFGTLDLPVPELYGMNLAGVQVWNCLRGVDFLAGLPEVDPERIGCTGASGGASQTILLMTIDERIKVTAPVNIIGMEKHPGCLCENSPGLWVDATTVELAAAFAPRPMILLSATEDPWTAGFPTRELPFIRKYYELYGAAEMVKNVHIQAGHNYNALTRAAVYEWFCRHLKAAGPPIKDPVPVSTELAALGDLRVFPDHILPESAVRPDQIIREWMQDSEKQYLAGLPASASQLDGFAETWGQALALLLHVDKVAAGDILNREESSGKTGNVSFRRVKLGRSGKGDCFTVETAAGDSSPLGTLVMVYPEEVGGVFLPGADRLRPWIEPLVSKGWRVVRVAGHASGELRIPKKQWDGWSWPYAYNRGNEQNAVQDILTALAWVGKSWPGEKIALAGLSRCGLPAAFAGALSGGLDLTLVDLDNRDPVYDRELLDLMPIGSLKRLGDFRTAALLLARKPLVVLNAGESLDKSWFESESAKLGLAGNLRFARSGEHGLWLPDLMRSM